MWPLHIGPATLPFYFIFMTKLSGWREKKAFAKTLWWRNSFSSQFNILWPYIFFHAHPLPSIPAKTYFAVSNIRLKNFSPQIRRCSSKICWCPKEVLFLNSNVTKKEDKGLDFLYLCGSLEIYRSLSICTLFLCLFCIVYSLSWALFSAAAV